MAIDWNAVGVLSGAGAAVTGVVVVPAAVLFHHKVIKPVRRAFHIVFGMAEEDTADGVAVPPLNQQMRELGKGQEVIHAELHEFKKEVSDRFTSTDNQLHVLAQQVSQNGRRERARP